MLNVVESVLVGWVSECKGGFGLLKIELVWAESFGLLELNKIGSKLE